MNTKLELQEERNTNVQINEASISTFNTREIPIANDSLVENNSKIPA